MCLRLKTTFMFVAFGVFRPPVPCLVFTVACILMLVLNIHKVIDRACGIHMPLVIVGMRGLPGKIGQSTEV